MTMQDWYTDALLILLAALTAQSGDFAMVHALARLDLVRSMSPAQRGALTAIFASKVNMGVADLAGVFEKWARED